MGFFDYVGGKIQQAGAEVSEAQRKAENWSEEKICMEIARTTKMTYVTGYGKELKLRASKMDRYSLTTLFDQAYDQRNIKAISVLMPVMEERGLANKDENGKIRRNY